jgi:hypothetical protein
VDVGVFDTPWYHHPCRAVNSSPAPTPAINYTWWLIFYLVARNGNVHASTIVWCLLLSADAHRSSVDTDALCLHECDIIGEGGKFWPSPTFMVTARDREDEPVLAKSCTGCWSQVGGAAAAAAGDVTTCVAHPQTVLCAFMLSCTIRLVQSKASCTMWLWM